MASVVCLGLTSIDLTYVVDRVPRPDEKVTARASTLDVGGPAANAARVAAVLGGDVRLVTAMGDGSLASMAVGLLTRRGVEVRDLLEGEPGAPPVSTVLVTGSTGQRAVVSLNAGAAPREPRLRGDELADDARVLLLDGHHMAAATALARQARARGIPVVLDGGSWKPGTDELLGWVDVAVVSSDFSPPEGGDVLALLRRAGCRVVAQSAGPGPVEVLDDVGRRVVEPPAVAPGRVVDTLGAGDVLHGALALLVAREGVGAQRWVERACAVASESCRHAGALGWANDEALVRRLRAVVEG